MIAHTGWLATIAGCALLCSSCGAGTTQTAPKLSAGSSALEQLFPLGEGTRWIFEGTAEGSGARTTLTVDARRSAKGSPELVTGDAKTTIEVRPDSIVSADGQILLKAPLTQGAAWDEGKGWRARVDAVDLAVTVPAGSYAGCVRVVSEVGPPSAGRVTTTYCPGIGRVAFASEDTSSSKRYVARFELKSVGIAPKTGATADASK